MHQLKNDRYNFILRYLGLHGTATVSVLCAALNVSVDTIRRDLVELAKELQLVRVHGGAILARHEPPKLPVTPARLIAEKTAILLCHNSFILTCGGDALMELYKLIPPTFNSTLCTVSMPIASRYSEHPLMEVIQIGDRVEKVSKLAAGGEAITKIRQIRADMCLLDATAIDSQRGLTESDWQISQVKKAMAESSEITVCLAESATLGKIAAVQACAPQKLTYLITELHAQDPALEAYRTMGIHVL